MTPRMKALVMLADSLHVGASEIDEFATAFVLAAQLEMMPQDVFDRVSTAMRDASLAEVR